jgi:hypothetical protein
MALHLAAHAWLSTPPNDASEAEGCNAHFARARRFLMHRPATDVVVLGEQVSPEQFEELRTEGLAELRDMCAACGGCTRFGLKAP